MAEQSWPFAGEPATEDRWGLMARHWQRRGGVLPDSPLGLLVPRHDAVNGGMRVIVGPGEGSVQGYHYLSDGDVTHGLRNPDTQPRIDAIVLRMDKTVPVPHRVRQAVVEGAAATSPALPALTRQAQRWDELITYIRVDPGGGGITFNNVRDARAFARDPADPVNLLRNPGFEIAPAGGTGELVKGWTASVVNGSIAVAAIASTIGGHGRSARLTYGHNGSLGGFADYKQLLNAVVGREYIQVRDRILTFAVDVLSSVAGTVQLWVSSGGNAPTTFSGFNVGTGEERLFVTHRTDPAATEIQIVVRIGNASAVVELNNATLTLGPVPLPFVPLNYREDLDRVRRVTPVNCRLGHSVNVNIPNVTAYNLPWDTTHTDPFGMHQSNAFPANEAITIIEPGQYDVFAEVGWQGGGNNGGMLSAQLVLNGSEVIGLNRVVNVDNARPPNQQVQGSRTLATGDVVRVQVYQDTGVSKDVTPVRFTARLAG